MPDGSSRVAFVTLGCKVNQAETDAFGDALLDFDQVKASEADVVVINTCAVTAEADRKARKAVRHALSMPQSPLVVVTGCLASLGPEGLRSIGDRVVIEADKALVPHRVREQLGNSPPDRATGGPRLSRSRVQVKVQDGCDARCAYCVVPRARGAERSVPLKTVVDEVERLAGSGVTEVVLTGVNIGRYHDRGVRLPELLEAVVATGIARVRVSSIEPCDVDERLLDVARRSASFCPHLHIPLQSGSDRVLGSMGRPYDTTRFAETIARARGAFPGIAITTDVISGFPGETDAEFEDTLAFVESQALSRLHVFRYSARVGTRAAALPDQVPFAVRAVRAARLRTLGASLAGAYAASHVGKTVEVLVEREIGGSRDAGVHVEGTTREYVRAAASVARATHGPLIQLAVEGVKPGPVLVGAVSSDVRVRAIKVGNRAL